MGKQIVYTKITPLPSNVPRQLALDLLHSHKEVIQMNPLVTDVKPIDPPRTAAADEFFSQWYEITEVITWGFGLKKKISFKGCFHDQPWGMQSHVFAPMNTDMRQTYKIGGNQPGEPRESRELGVDTPLDGLYLREEVNIICNTPLVAGFIKKEMKDASKVMIDRISRKAELVDEGKLHAMFEDGRLKTSKPSAEATYDNRSMPSPSFPGTPPGSPPSSMGTFPSSLKSPLTDSRGFGNYYNIAPGRSESVRSNQYQPSYQQPGYQGPDYAKSSPGLPGQHSQQQFVSELPGSFYQPQQNSLYPPPLKPNGGGQQQVFRAELQGDTGPYKQPSPNQSQYQQDVKSTPSPPSQHPAFQHSPQPSPRLPNPEVPSRNNSQGSYQIANPDPPAPSFRPNSYEAVQKQDPAPSVQQSAGYNSTAEQWRRSVQNDQPIASNYYSNGRPDDNVQPDHQRMSRLSIQQNAEDVVPAQAQTNVSSTMSCPVCQLFQGDEAAVSHHVTKAHFQ